MQKILADKYEVKEIIGSGGSGTVYRVWDRNLESDMAVKELGPSGMWEREREALKKLRHPALPVITDYFETEGRKFIVMDYIEGITLLQYMRKYGRVKQNQAIIWGRELADVLCYLHGQRVPVIYRDMKPSNVMIDKSGKIKLIDFGTVYLKYSDREEHYVRAGTFGYAAPEQMQKEAFEQTDDRCDIYGLGITLHQMLTGKNPAEPPFCPAPIRSYDRALSKGLEKIVAKAVMPEKEKRYESMRQMKEELECLEEKEKREYHGRQVLCAVYYISLGILIAGFLVAYYKVELHREITGKGLWENRMLLFAFGVLGLCLVRWLLQTIAGSSKRQQIRTYRSVYLSEKKNTGFFLLLSGLLLTAFLSLSQTAVAEAGRALPVYEMPSAEEKLPVIVYGEEGRKLLIKYDAVYGTENGMRLFLPPESFEAGKKYILRIECIGEKEGEKRSRTFRLERAAP